ncbi:MAG TPA: hypothetical protein VJV78_21310 [Polyangiales bacterium]|nr:hypothetical protein [Polyangiales bacterium]
MAWSRRRSPWAFWLVSLVLPGSVLAQEPAPDPDAGVTEPAQATDAAVVDHDAAPPEAEPAPEVPRGDTPVSLEAVVNPQAAPTAPPPPPPPPPSEPTAPPKTHAPVQETPPPPPPPPAALIVWATAGLADALGTARCGAQGLEGTDAALRLLTTLRRSVRVAGLGVGAAGALGDHPLIAWAARAQPQLLADLLAEAGFKALALGVSDVNGPLLREAQLSAALARRGIAVVASNLRCRGQVFCSAWTTAEDGLLILERDGRKYALMAVLPDDLLARVEPADGRSLELRSAADTLTERTEQARAAGADLIVASIDHGPDPTASVNLANFVSALPPDIRPDLLLSPSSADNLLFMRPLDVHPAIVGTRRGVLTGLRVTKLPETRDSDVFARSVRLDDPNPELAARLSELGKGYCASRGQPLPGGRLEAPLSGEELVTLAGSAARELARADLIVLDPLVYDGNFSQPAGTQLQRGQMERAVLLDSPLVSAAVPLDWLNELNKRLSGLRPLTLIGTSTDGGDPTIAGRLQVTGASYRIVTSAVLARSGRLPDGARWRPVDRPAASLRGALLRQLSAARSGDPRSRLHDPYESTQWILRADAGLLANLTATKDKGDYAEPALQVNDSRQIGARLVLNVDADAPGFLFENAAQVAFDRNFATKTTAQDLVTVQTTYTYRGLWPTPLLYPHPFLEGYLETQFERGDADYHHLLLRPEAGLRSMVSRVLSLKVSFGVQYEALQPGAAVRPGIGAELLLKPWTIGLGNGPLQLEGNVLYYWNSPGKLDEHTLRGQLISSVQVFGPLQVTLTALGVLRKDPDQKAGKGLSIQAGIRLRFVDRSMVE